MFYNLRYSNHVLNSTKVKVQIAYNSLLIIADRYRIVCALYSKVSGPTDYCEALDRLQR